jgi:UDPglucose 6-dehydrogenase
VTERIGVVGSGYVGTVVAACLAHVGHEVVGVEIEPHKLQALRAGDVPFFEGGLPELVASGLASGRLRFTDDVGDAMRSSRVVFLCVGTPSGGDGLPDMSAAATAARSLALHVDGHVFVTKSTVPIGSGQWLRSVIEDADPALDRDAFAVVSNPEFLREGSAVRDFLHPDRVVIGSDDEWALNVVEGVYRPILDQAFASANGRRPPLVRTSQSTAETIKYAANAFLAMKISFANELANVCELVGAEVTEVTSAIGLDHRIGVPFLRSGIGWGGSCFGKDLAALVSTVEEYGSTAPLLSATIEVNERQRLLVVEKIRRHLKTLRGRRIAILGLAFKPGTDDLRDAPALAIAARLLAAGAIVTGHDPVVHQVPDLPELRLASDPYEAVVRADAVLVATEWDQYKDLDLADICGRMRGVLLVDGRNMFDPELVSRAGLVYEGIGRAVPRSAVVAVVP